MSDKSDMFVTVKLTIGGRSESVTILQTPDDDHAFAVYEAMREALLRERDIPRGRLISDVFARYSGPVKPRIEVP